MKLDLEQNVKVVKIIWKTYGLEILHMKTGWCSGTIPNNKYGTYATLEITLFNQRSNAFSFIDVQKQLTELKDLLGWDDRGWAQIENGNLLIFINNYNYLR